MQWLSEMFHRAIFRLADGRKGSVLWLCISDDIHVYVLFGQNKINSA